MTDYTIRIELHDASWDEYEEMYGYLAAVGITDVITSDKGISYKMPPAEYNYQGSENRSQVLEMAKAAATRVVSSFAVLVTQANGRTWHGLEKV